MEALAIEMTAWQCILTVKRGVTQSFPLAFLLRFLYNTTLWGEGPVRTRRSPGFILGDKLISVSFMILEGD